VFASLLAMFSYVAVSVNLPEGEITIKVGKKKPGAAAATDGQVQASG